MPKKIPHIPSNPIIYLLPDQQQADEFAKLRTRTEIGMLTACLESRFLENQFQRQTREQDEQSRKFRREYLGDWG